LTAVLAYKSESFLHQASFDVRALRLIYCEDKEKNMQKTMDIPENYFLDDGAIFYSVYAGSHDCMIIFFWYFLS